MHKINALVQKNNTFRTFCTNKNGNEEKNILPLVGIEPGLLPRKSTTLPLCHSVLMKFEGKCDLINSARGLCTMILALTHVNYRLIMPLETNKQ